MDVAKPSAWNYVNENSHPAEVPKIIWSFWDEGFGVAPPLVQLCIATWHEYSGIEDIRLLDLENVYHYLDRSSLPKTFESLPVQLKSDAIRLALLARYGGVWLDASTLVTARVHDFVQSAAAEGSFFAFHNGSTGKGGRSFEIGALAVTPRNPFFEQWSAHFNDFFSRKRIHFAHSPNGPASSPVKIIFGILNRYLTKSVRRSAWWVRAPLRHLPFYPYFVTYYLANRLLLTGGFCDQLNEERRVPASKYLWFRNELNHGRGLAAIGDLFARGQVLSDVEFRLGLEDEELGLIASALGIQKITGRPRA